MDQECLKCHQLADGLDGIHCQEHWEQDCGDEFWGMIQGLEQVVNEAEHRFDLRDALAKARANHPDFDELPL